MISTVFNKEMRIYLIGNKINVISKETGERISNSLKQWHNNEKMKRIRHVRS